MAELTYRPITDLSDEELASLLTCFVYGLDGKREEDEGAKIPQLLSISRNVTAHEVTLTYRTWVHDPEDDTEFDVEDDIWINEYEGCAEAHDFGFTAEEQQDIAYRLMAFGCHPLLNGNPYLK